MHRTFPVTSRLHKVGIQFISRFVVGISQNINTGFGIEQVGRIRYE